MKKPDRFERAVKAWANKLPMLELIDLEPHVVKLLRAEHAWVVRMVKNLRKRQQEITASYPVNSQTHKYGIERWKICNDILNQLTQRRK